ncbi:SH3 domain-containing protein [Heterostelium album PN500]|uniref:SH3 domain-containing protein n=1 Tax=Heterostelium pallidum (strain ATCC 26659 / Pp 5 / PN500) TaxID=670386 RepID=D3BRX3_HETP5|nr:SH3 domain-containing protein [Heterostelium album PN500]EFA75710.1 SH3 domain-containing protein [Heterostelium album PN500]|eukprot:XP_020427844.1 SH3 domain-containing protein [Heterostelium album PN500]
MATTASTTASVGNINRGATTTTTNGGGGGGEWIEINKTCIVMFPFNASHKFQLPLSVGDLVQIHAQTSGDSEQGWFSGVSLTTQESGIFPQSYVVLLPENINDITMPHHVPISSRLNITNQSLNNCALLNEITSTIVEWATLLKIFSQNKQYNDFKVLTTKITQLVQFRNQLLNLPSQKELTFELRDKILNSIDEGRQETGMTIVLRKEVQNQYSVATSNPRNSQIAMAATDLILADAENSGVFTLCTMYQEKKLLLNNEIMSLKTLDSARKDDSSLNLASMAQINNGGLNGSNHASPNSISPSTSGTSISLLNGSTGFQKQQQQQQQLQQEHPVLQSSHSSLSLSLSSNSSSGSNSSVSSSGSSGISSSGSSSNLAINASPNSISQQLQQQQQQQQQPISSQASLSSLSLSSASAMSNNNNNSSSASSSNSSGTVKSKPMNFLSSVRLKGKSQSVASSLGSSGGMPPLSSQQSSSNLMPNGQQMSSSPSGSTSSLANSFISVTSSSPSSLASSPSNGSPQVSSLNLNSPLLTNGTARRNTPTSLLKSHLSSSTNLLAKTPRSGGSFLQNGSSSSSSSLSSASLEYSSKSYSQLLFSLNNFLYSSGEYLELIISIYSKNENKFITENYCGIVPPSGIFVEPENPNEKIRTIFKDLESKDVQSELYLVAKIYRRTGSISSKDPNSSPTLTRSNASMVPTSSTMNSSSFLNSPTTSKQFKKYIGCGVKKIDFNTDISSEILISLFTTPNESTSSQLHEHIINETSGSYEPITRAKGIVCTIQPFHGEYTQFLSENADLRNVSTSLKMQLPEVIVPGYDRNDMYIQIEEGEFSEKNIEVAMLVRSDNGVVMTDSIKYANGQPELSEYRTSIQSTSSTCRFNETVKVWMAAKTFSSAHLFFLVRACSEKKDRERQTLAFGYLRFIGDDGSVIKDGSHTINLYRTNSDDVAISSYINGVVDTSAGGKSSSKKYDQLKIKTTFVSTCLTQNHLVVNLSKWQSFQGDLSSLIKDITFLGQQELIRNLQEIFYNFLAILDQQLNDSPLSMEIFRSFIFIIGVLVDSRTTNYRPALDVYISKFFGVPLNVAMPAVGISAHSHLLRSVVKNLENFQDPSNASKISSSLKALEYIFKMVVASRTRFPNKVDVVAANENYQNNLKNVVDTLCEIMISNSPSLIGAQTIALKNFEGMFSDLKKFFTVEEMGIIALKFIKSIQHLEKNKTFNMLKLKLLSSYLHGELMLNKETRKQLHPIVFQLLQFHFGKSIEETDMCLTILGLILDMMITKQELRGKDKDAWLMDMMSFFVQILELLQLINANIASMSAANVSLGFGYNMNKRRSSSSVSLNGATASVSLATMISSLSEENQYDLRLKIYAFILGTARLAGIQNWEMFSKSVTSKTFFVDLYDNLAHLFDTPKFPSDFWTFTVFKLKTILRMTRILEDVTFYVNPTKLTTGANSADSNGSPPSGSINSKTLNQFDFQLWRSFFLMTSSYLNCKDLQFESVNPAKAVFLKSRCGDVRIEMARVFERVWGTVPLKERASFIPVLIDPIIKLLISDTIDAKRVATKIFYDMLEGEISLTGAYSELMTRTVDSLLECGTSISDGMTWPVVSRGVDAKLPFTQRTFATFFNNQCMQLVLSKSIDSVKKQAEQFIHDISHFVLLLTTFITDVKNMDEEEIFSSVSKLILYFQEHKRTNHYIRFLQMCNKRHHANEILACYNKGKAWDRAIPLLKELTHHVSVNICDMASCATYLRQHSTFVQKLNDSDAVFEEYFRVGYYGKKFPSNLQNKEFIYKGNEFERLSDFIAKTCEKWPKAELLKSTETPSQSIMDSDAQYLLITTVNVSSMNEIHKRHSLNMIDNYGSSTSNKKRVPLRVQQLNARNRVNVFLYSKPFRKPGHTKSSSDNEFENLWLMNIYLVCETHFPSTERRSRVIDRHQYEVSPIENALNSVVQKNEELLARIDKYSQPPTNGQPDNINPLTMTLNGIIDASVNGGIARYEHFLTNQYLQQHPDNKHFVDYLKVAMDQQLIVLEQALKLHGQLRPPEMAALQEKLELIFNTMKSERSQSYVQ